METLKKVLRHQVLMDLEKRIMRFLESSERGRSVSEIASALKADRRTVAKRLEVMRAKGMAECEKVGVVKLWSLSKSPIISLLVKENEEGHVLRGILNSLDEGISILDTDLNIIWANEKIKGMAERLNRLKGRRCYETYIHRSDICAKCPATQTIETDRVSRSVEKGVGINGKKYHYQFVTSPIKDAKGRTIAILEIVRDLSDIGE